MLPNKTSRLEIFHLLGGGGGRVESLSSETAYGAKPSRVEFEKCKTSKKELEKW